MSTGLVKKEDIGKHGLFLRFPFPFSAGPEGPGYIEQSLNNRFSVSAPVTKKGQRPKWRLQGAQDGFEGE